MSVPWIAFFRLLIAPLIEPVVSMTNATSACLMLVLNLSTSLFGFGSSPNGTTKKKSRLSPVLRSWTTVSVPTASPCGVDTWTVVLLPSVPAGSEATEVNVAPANEPSVPSFSLNVAPAVRSVPLLLTLNAAVPGVAGFVAESMMTVVFFGSSVRTCAASPPKPGVLPPGSPPGSVALFSCSASKPERPPPPLHPTAMQRVRAKPEPTRAEGVRRIVGGRMRPGRNGKHFNCISKPLRSVEPPHVGGPRNASNPW